MFKWDKRTQRVGLTAQGLCTQSECGKSLHAPVWASWIHAWLTSTLLFAIPLPLSANAESRFPGIGRPATPAEIKAWDIDVRADFKGLPPGNGSVARGQDIWDAKCASCHGTFGESNEVFTPIVGHTRVAEQKIGRVAALQNPEVQRTTMMKLSTVSTLWDYVNRAMPWNAPKTLTTEEVYAVTAFMLNLADIVPQDFVLTDKNIADVQKRLPNRYGKTREHGLWTVRGKPDVRSSACMKNCDPNVVFTSQLPDFARGSHGNLALQQRTTTPFVGTPLAGKAGQPQAASLTIAKTADQLMAQNGCIVCHQAAQAAVGPSVNAIRERYGKDSKAPTQLASSIKMGGSGRWGNIPMPPHPDIADADLAKLVEYFLKE
jgi:cytochrome c